jgi:site-specific DNA recombinase
VDNSHPIPRNSRYFAYLSARFLYATICTPIINPTFMNCVLYARVSTDKQAEKELSIPAQLQAMRDYARQNSWDVVSEFIEPGASARTTERPALQELLSAARAEKPTFAVVLVHKIDRLARNVHDHATIRALFKQQGIRLASVVENMDNSVSGELIENIMASIAQFYSANLSEEVKKGMRQKVLKGGWPHRPPRGYAIVRTARNPNGSIEIHSKDGPLMRRGFELYASGWYSVQTVANRLAREGLLGVTGRPIAHAHLSRLLANSFYAGMVRWGGVEYPGTHSPLVSRELFDKVQAVMRQRFENPGPRGSVISGFPLRGLAICASCRGRMTCERHGKWRYYRCSRQTFRRELCPARMCNADRAHKEIERVCGQVRIDRQLADRIGQAAGRVITARVAEAHNRRQKVDKERDALTQTEMRLAATFAAGDMTPSDYKHTVNDLRGKQQRLGQLETQAPLSSALLAESVGRTLQLVTSLWDVYEPMNDLRRATLLKSVFGTVVLDHNGIAGFTMRPPFDMLLNSANTKPPEELAKLIVDAAA